MELLRLGLERGRTAEETVMSIAELLEKYGQYGSAVQGSDHEEGSYENAFILADCKELWILETSGRRWVTRKVTGGIYTLSNQPTIRTDWTKASPDLEKYARDMGWSKAEEEYDFALAYGDHEHYSRQVSHLRWCRTRQLMNHYNGEIDESNMMTILRDHYENTFLNGPQFNAFLPDFQTVCMHDSPAGFTWGNTATSFIVELSAEYSQPPVIWLSYQPPCTSTYLALVFSARLPDIVTSAGRAGLGVHQPALVPKDEFDSRSLWWRFYRLLGEVKQRPHERFQLLRAHLDPVENAYIEKVKRLTLEEPPSPGQKWEKLSRAHIEEVLKALEKLEVQWNLK
jgi:secernin